MSQGLGTEEVNLTVSVSEAKTEEMYANNNQALVNTIFRIFYDKFNNDDLIARLTMRILMNGYFTASFEKKDDDRFHYKTHVLYHTVTGPVKQVNGLTRCSLQLNITVIERDRLSKVDNQFTWALDVEVSDEDGITIHHKHFRVMMRAYYPDILHRLILVSHQMVEAISGNIIQNTDTVLEKRNTHDTVVPFRPNK